MRSEAVATTSYTILWRVIDEEPLLKAEPSSRLQLPSESSVRLWANALILCPLKGMIPDPNEASGRQQLNSVPKTFVWRRVSTARTTAKCQTRRGDEFAAQFYCVIKGVV